MVHCCCACAEPYLHSLVNKVAQLSLLAQTFWKERQFQSQEQPFLEEETLWGQAGGGEVGQGTWPLVVATEEP